MADDARIKLLIDRYGIEGYGIYCLLLEDVTKNMSTVKPTPFSELSASDMAEFYKCDSNKVLEIMLYMERIGLLNFDTVSRHIGK
jgi:hypothetical protein